MLRKGFGKSVTKGAIKTGALGLTFPMFPWARKNHSKSRNKVSVGEPAEGSLPLILLILVAIIPL